MILNKNEYRIMGLNSQEESCEGIFISKKALEEWREHFANVSRKHKQNHDKELSMYYLGRSAVLIDILKHFEEE